MAVECGYWNLYRYDPRKLKPFSLDSKRITRELSEFINI